MGEIEGAEAEIKLAAEHDPEISFGPLLARPVKKNPFKKKR